jgi:integrase
MSSRTLIGPDFQTASALQWTEIDFDSGIMNVTKSLEQTKKGGLRVKSTKSDKPRRFAVPATVLEALKEHRQQQEQDKKLFGRDYEDNGLVSCRADGRYYSPDRVGARVVALTRRAGPAGVSPHSLRHTHASELLSKGCSAAHCGKRLGHANPAITLSIYAHALEADEVAAARIWEDAMADVIGTHKRQTNENLGLSRFKALKSA